MKDDYSFLQEFEEGSANALKIKEIIFAHIAKSLRNESVSTVFSAIAIPEKLSFDVIIGCLARLQNDGIETWDIALRVVLRQCVQHTGSHQTL